MHAESLCNKAEPGYWLPLTTLSLVHMVYINWPGYQARQFLNRAVEPITNLRAKKVLHHRAEVAKDF